MIRITRSKIIHLERILLINSIVYELLKNQNCAASLIAAISLNSEEFINDHLMAYYA